MSVDTGRREDPVADLALRKAAAFDEFTRWLGGEIGMEWSTVMTPEWVMSMLRTTLTSRLSAMRGMNDGNRARRMPWLRRTGW